MRDRALQIVSSRPPAADGTNLLREYVQSRVLGQMQEAGVFVPLAFMGGTALRFLYRIPRFSEDLDFTLERPDGFSFTALTERLDRGLTREGYRMSMKVDTKSPVAKAWIGFAGLLAEADLSPHVDHMLWVKLEVDTNPPAGAGLEVSTVNVFGLLRLQHHDKPSLLAGKLAAILARQYTKGRDFYDLMWYLTQTPAIEPNLTLLGNALAQTAPDLAESSVDDWRAMLRERLAQVDWADVRRDVAPFLEQARDIDLLNAATFNELLG